MFYRLAIPFGLVLLAALAACAVAVLVCVDSPDLRLRLLIFLLIVGAAAETAVLALSGRVARRMAQPLRELTRAAERLGTGSSDQRVYTDTHSEMDVLGRAFNRMSDQLATRIAALEEDRQQLRAVLSGMVEGRRRPRRRTAHPVRQRPGRGVAGVPDAGGGRPPTLGGGAAAAAAGPRGSGAEAAGTVPRGAAPPTPAPPAASPFTSPGCRGRRRAAPSWCCTTPPTCAASNACARISSPTSRTN